MLIGEILANNALNWPNHPAVSFNGTSLSFAELHHQCNRVSNALLALSEDEDRVAVLSTNNLEYVQLLYGVSNASRILVLLNYRLLPEEWARNFVNSGASVLIIEEKFLDDFEKVRTSLKSLRNVVVIGEAREGMLSYHDVMAKQPTVSPAILPKPQSGAILVYTSGTTGSSKGALLSNDAVMHAIASYVMMIPRPSHSNVLQVFPMCHVSCLSVLGGHLRASHLHIMPHFDPDLWFDMVEAHKIVHMSIAPTMLALLRQHPRWKTAHLKSWRSCDYGGGPMPVDIIRDLYGRGIKASAGWGQTEATFLITVLSSEDHERALEGEEHILASCGRAGWLAAVRIVDDQLNEVPAGEIGELCIRSVANMIGYWNNPEATAETLRDGWLLTGDMGRVDRDGFFYLVDRKKDMVKTGGQNVYTQEVEKVLESCPGVAIAAVFGLPDPIWGEIVVAAVEVRPGLTVSERDLLEACSRTLAGYKKPKRFFFLESIPKNVTGKILKRELRKQYSSQVDRAAG